MRTTLDLPEALLEEARVAAGCRTKTETIIHALKETVRRKKVESLKAMLGTVAIDINLAKTRGRPASS